MRGICELSCIPLRKEPSGKSELVSMILFGETYHILEQQNSWILIINDFDSYQGWISENQLSIIEGEIPEQKTLASGLLGTATNDDGRFFVPAGSVLPDYSHPHFNLNNKKYLFDGTVQNFQGDFDRNKLLKDALMFLNTPYLWGGKTAMGIDCSGFCQVVYKLNGINLLRDASQQAIQGNTLCFLEETKPGDLAFFDNEDGKIIHVGILLGGYRIIHASGKVRIDQIDHQGIFNKETHRYSHRLRLIKTYPRNRV